MLSKTLGLAALAATLVCGAAYAQQKEINVKVGVLTDMASLYADDTGQGSVAAAQMAAEDFMKSHPNVKVTVVSADHQNKADVGTNIANQWFDVDHVDMIVDVPNSGVALAIAQVAAAKNKVFVGSGPASSDLTGPKCTPTPCTGPTTPGCWRTAPARPSSRTAATPGSSSPRTTPSATRSSATPRRWSTANGGKVLGAVRHPINTSDFSSFLLQAQASKAKIIGLANAGGDTINASSRAPSSASSRAARNSPVCSCSRRTSPRSA